MEINRRRMDLLGDRIEAVCATHKRNARAWGGFVRRGRLIVIVTCEPEYDLRNLKDDIGLCLGVPVTVFRDAVICERLP